MFSVKATRIKPEFFQIYPVVTILISNIWSCSSPSPPKVETGKISGYTRLKLFVGWGEGLYVCELENTPEK